MFKKISITSLLVFALCFPVYAQKGSGSRSFGGGSSFRSSGSSSFSSRSSGNSSSPRISSSSPGSSLAKSRALTSSANQKSAYQASQNRSSSSSVSSGGSNSWFSSNNTRSTSSSNNSYRKTVVVPQSNYQTRNVRITNVYKNYPPTYNNYHYNDSFHPFLTGMLIGRLMDNHHHTETVRYIHSNWNSFDEARKQQLLRENAGLKAELDAMNGVPPDPNVRLSGVDEDVTYHDNYVTTPTNWMTVFGWFLAITVLVVLVIIFFTVRFDI